MIVDVAVRPQRVTLCQWTGTNTDQVAAYVATLTGTWGSAEFVADSAEQARIVFTYSYQTVPDKLVRAGEWIQGMSDHYGPFANVWTADEVNARWFPYPEHGSVDPNGNPL